MKNHSGRWSHVYKLWKSALNQESFPQFDRWLSNEFAKNSKYGSKDRRWYSEVLFAAIRHGYFALLCDYLFLSAQSLTAKSIEEFHHKFKSHADIFDGLKKGDVEDFFIWIALRYQSSNGNSLDDSFFTSIPQNKKTFFSNLVEKIENENSTNYKLLFYSVPLWFLNYFNQRVQFSKFNLKQINQFLSDLDSRPPLWLRLNHMDKKEEVIQELTKESYAVEDFNSCIKVTGAKGVFTLNSYRTGLFEIQDLASQKIGEHVRATPKQYVWDCCAGGGGKTLQIASFLKNKGVVYASDIREYKLEEVKKRAKRSGFFNIRCLTWNGEALPQFQKEVQIKGGFDWVLVDAPCSSTGTWRRNPDAKYRVDEENIKNLSKLQLSILTQASLAVINGGHLVYSTCSWIVEENETVVEQFLQAHPEFSLVEQNLLGNPFDNADTMFAAVLEKKLTPLNK